MKESPLNFLVFLSEGCLPPDSGGRRDRWSRFAGFSELGCEMRAVVWGRDARLSEEMHSKYCSIFKSILYFQVPRSFPSLAFRLAKLVK